MPKKLTTQEFVEKAVNIHGNKYDYSKVIYETTQVKVNIFCFIHGEFWQTPASHLSGAGCPKCYGNRTTSKEKFVEKANAVHNNKYDYSKMLYVEGNEKICIVCPIHAEFWQTKNNHLNGKGCPVCGRTKCDLARRVSKESFITDANNIHNFKYDYSLVKYETRKDKIKIICPKHGEFEQTVSSHLQGHGCLQCGWESCAKSNVYSWEFVKKQCKNIHGDLYEYPDQIYKNSKTNIRITCNKHGEFLQRITNHLQGEGCPICKYSKGELLIYNWLKENNILFKTQFKLIIPEVNTKTNLLKIDFFVKQDEKQYFIEYDGIQHYEYIPHFHKGGIIDFEKQQKRDKLLNDFCELYKDKVTLVRFNYKQNNEEIIETLYNTFKTNVS